MSLLHHPVLIVTLPLLFALLTPVVGMLKKSLSYFWVLLALLLSTTISVNTLVAVIRHGTIHYKLGDWSPPFGIEYVIDHFNAMMLVIVSGISLLVAIYSFRSVERELPKKIDYF